MELKKLALLALAALTLDATPSCANFSPYPVCEKFNQFPVVFRGRAVRTHQWNTDGTSRAVSIVQVLEVFKGISPAQSVILLDARLHPGEEFLIFTRPYRRTLNDYWAGVRPDQRPGGLWSLYGAESVYARDSLSCYTGDDRVQPNDPRLAILRSAAAGRFGNRGSIRGYAFLDSKHRGLERQPVVAGALVRIQDGDRTWTTKSRSDGWFEVNDVPAGSYSVTLEKPGLGNSILPFDGKWEVTPGGCAFIRANFTTHAIINGKLIPAPGETAEGIAVEVRSLAGSIGEQDGWSVARSNPDGSFQLRFSPSGPVRVGVNLESGSPSELQPFDQAISVRLQVRPRDVLNGVTLQLPPRLRFGDLTVRVRVSDGKHFEGEGKVVAHWRGHWAAESPVKDGIAALKLAFGLHYELTFSTGSQRPVAVWYRENNRTAEINLSPSPERPAH